jgi:hypothetical protein
MWGMKGPDRRISTPAEYKRSFVARTRQMRERKYEQQKEIAKDLSHAVGRHIDPDTYRKYEKDAMLPHDLIMPFCELCECDPWELMTGSRFDLGTYMAAQRRKASLS